MLKTLMFLGLVALLSRMWLLLKAMAITLVIRTECFPCKCKFLLNLDP